MTSLNERIDFFGIAEDKLIYDERKKRFVHTKDLPGFMTREMMNGAFKTVSTPQAITLISRDPISLDKRRWSSRGSCASASS